MMNTIHSDAPVFFGTIGDLAHGKVFPALQAMVKGGHLNVPVLSVAKSYRAIETSSRPRAKASRNMADERALGGAMAGDSSRFGRESYIKGAWRTVEPILKNLSPFRSARSTPWGPAPAKEAVTPSGGWDDPVILTRPIACRSEGGLTTEMIFQ
jgi:glucose-6-phosphate 1-dehydrogenase